MKKFILIISLLCPIIVFGQGINNKTSINDDVITNFLQLSMQQLFDSANYYYDKNNYEIALIAYNLLIITAPKIADSEQQDKIFRAYNRLVNMYLHMSDYRMAYDISIKALLFSEKYNSEEFRSSTYLNIGVIYSYLNQYDIAKQYFLKSLEICKDSISLILLRNNLGDNETSRGKPDSSLYYINKALILSEQHNNVYKGYIISTLASYYKSVKLYDSAFNNFKLSLDDSRIRNDIQLETHNLTTLSKLFFQINKIDSALHYIDLSNKIAAENKFLKILADNYLLLSEIQKSKGNYKNALQLHETYTNLKDSIFNAGVFGSINLIQRQYEVSKTNQQIEELVINKQINENTIYYQKIILLIVLGVLALVVFVLIFIMHQKRNLNKAYKALVDRNIEIVEIQDDPSEANKKKHKKSARNYDKYSELLNNILVVMEDPKIFCDPEFSIDKLAELVQSNQKYVSEAINNILNKNFRSFLNSYRIREAQQRFTTMEIEKYTLEYVVPLVGFKSSKTFWDAFKEITGVTPNYYLKSIQDKFRCELKKGDS